MGHQSTTFPPELEFSQGVADYICERIGDGKSLRTILAEMPDSPAQSTVYRWLSLVPSFSEQYARARETQADTLADEIVAIADEGETKVIVGGDGTSMVVFDSTAVARNRLRMDARKWVAAKLKPRKYGEKIELEHSGSIEKRPDDWLESRIAELVAKAGIAGAVGGAGEASEEA